MSNVTSFQAAFQRKFTDGRIAERQGAIKATAEKAAKELCQVLGFPGSGIEAQVIAADVESEMNAKPLPCAYCDPANETRGSKFESTRDLDIKDVASMIRADVKQAIKTGALPGGLKTSVKIERFSGGQALNIAVKYLDGSIFNPNWVKATKNFAEFFSDEVHEVQRQEGRYSAELQEVKKKLQEIGDAYNRDNSDSMSDYFDKRFYLHVGVDHDLEQVAKARETV